MSFLSEEQGRRTRVGRLLDARVENVSNAITNHLFRQIESAQGRLNAATTPQEITRAVTQLRDSVNTDQLEDLVAGYIDEYREKIRLINSQFGNPQFSDLDRERTQSLIANGLDRVAGRLDIYLQQIETEILYARTQGIIIDSSAIRERFEDRVTSNLNTEVTTQVDAFERTTTVIKGLDLGFELFLYVGGIIKTTRPFCRERDGKVFSWDEIRRWSNGQVEPASVFLGGFNCRHHLAPITEEVARDEFGYRE